jgi:hypothetical protein
MSGFLYRGAVALKDFGERHDMPLFIRLGRWLRRRVMKYAAGR